MSINRHQAVGAYRPWRPEAFDQDAEEQLAPLDFLEPPPPPPVAAPEPLPEPEPEPMLEPAFQLPTADDIERMFESARQEGHASGLIEGRTAGHTEGFNQGMAESKAIVTEQAARLAALADQLENALAALESEVAEEITALAVEVARQLVHRTLSDHPAAITETVRQALTQLPHAAATIRLHPEDLALVREYMGEALEHGGHRLIEDPAITRGGCLLESGGSHLDATLQTRWRHVLEALGRNDEVNWDDEES